MRLTDINVNPILRGPIDRKSPIKYCSMGPMGLFVFMINAGYLAASLTSKLLGRNFISDLHILHWACFAICASGLLLLLCGMWEVTRNNICRATAFSTFRCFWLVNGLKMRAETYFSAKINPELLNTPYPWSGFICLLLIFRFCLNLLYQTLAHDKISATLIFFLSPNIFLE